jgi:hypothetical protein
MTYSFIAKFEHHKINYHHQNFTVRDKIQSATLLSAKFQRQLPIHVVNEYTTISTVIPKIIQD